MDAGLLAVSNAFHAGNYLKSMEQASALIQQSPQEDLRQQGQCLLLQSQLGMGQFQPVLQATQGQQHPMLRSMHWYTVYMTAKQQQQRSQAVSELKTVLEGVKGAPGWLVARVASLAADILVAEGLLEDAAKAVSPYAASDLECAAVMVRCFIKINRTDLALNQVVQMKKLNEDAVVTLLSEASQLMALGHSKYQDAFYIYQELLETYGSTPKLLIFQSTALMAMHKFAEAEKLLVEAQQKNNMDGNVLANLIVCSRYLQRPEERLNELQHALKTHAPQHPLLKEMDLKSSLYDRCAQKYHS